MPWITEGWDLGKCSPHASGLLVAPATPMKPSGLPGDVEGSTSWHIGTFRGPSITLATVQNRPCPDSSHIALGDGRGHLAHASLCSLAPVGNCCPRPSLSLYF